LRRPRLILLPLVFAVAGCGGGRTASPSGWIVFAAGQGGAGDIAMVRPDGTGFRRLTHGDPDATAVTWLTRNRVAVDFAPTTGDDTALWAMAADGTQRQKLRIPTSDHEVAVGPGGRQAVVSVDGVRLYLADLRTGSARSIGAGAAPTMTADGALHFANRGWIWTRRRPAGQGHRVLRGNWASFSPDGRALVFLRGDALWMADADGRAARLLTRSGTAVVAWSPDSRSVAWFCNRGHRGALRICTTPRASGAVRVVAVAHTRQDAFSWGRNGLAFVAGTGPTRGIWTWRDHGPGRLLVAGNVLDPAWSPDGSRLAYLRVFPWAGPPLDAVAIVDSTGRTRQITRPVVDSSPTGSPDGRWIVFDRRQTAGARTENIRLAIHRDGSGLHRVRAAGAIVWAPPQSLRFAARSSRYLKLTSSDGRLVAAFPLPRMPSQDLELTPGALLPGGALGVAVSSDSAFCGIYVLTPRGPPRPLRPQCPQAEETSWSADGSLVAASDFDGVWVAPVAAGLPHRILSFPDGDIFASLAWSPDARFLAVAVDHDQNELHPRSDIVVFDAAGHRLDTAVTRAIGGSTPIWLR
jgi:Tol biopolymer transport system component